jgi:hypothetical protein
VRTACVTERCYTSGDCVLRLAHAMLSSCVSAAASCVLHVLGTAGQQVDASGRGGAVRV